MKNIIFKFTLAFTIALMANNVQAQTKPNILFVIVDDFGYHDISANGSKIYQTPNIDKLASTSASFVNSYACYPRCVPSRSGILSGKYPVNEDNGNLGQIADDKNFIKQFKSAGYASFYVGKWHLGSEESSPKGFGFDQSFAAGEAGATGEQFYPFNKDRVKGEKGEKAAVEDVEEYAKPGDFLTDVLTKRTIEYIKTNKSGQPFVGVLAYYAVHTPIEAKPEDIARNKKEIDAFDYGTNPDYIAEGNGQTHMRQNDPIYAGLVENVDENIGKLIQTLKDQGVYDNTIIVLTSDHGGLSTRGKNNRIVPTSNAPLRAGKGWLYEGGVRVPLIVHLPKTTKPTLDKESIVMGMDIFPTLTDIALNKQISGIDGKSFKNVLLKKENWNQRTVYWNSYKARPTQTGDDKTSAIRVGDYKLLHFIETDKVQLYDIKKDVGEKNDLAATMPDKKQEMLKMLNQWKSEHKIAMKPNHKEKAELTPEQEAKKAERKANKKN
ncbi:sulfatase [Flavobacterium nackdongense]|uniref:DUF4976 domain-containing protein n=1 Tax=Flavobacterium nackdongense TaxID=2547394 RepID=A0A4P6YIL8_9FLAO|nr:sulfatase [Flavobacterium nackdongense]QBN20450.1 DUF4976 domain-containing protein [Flavobacterium nackdongense]